MECARRVMRYRAAEISAAANAEVRYGRYQLHCRSLQKLAAAAAAVVWALHFHRRVVAVSKCSIAQKTHSPLLAAV